MQSPATKRPPQGICRADYEREIQKLKDLIATNGNTEFQILVTQRRIVAMATLLNLPIVDLRGLVGIALRRGYLTDTIRHIFAGSPTALTPAAVIAELQRLGFPTETHVNLNASVNAICTRLVQQGFLRKAERSPNAKGLAWVLKNSDPQGEPCPTK